jgi:hypothetical protein
MDILTALEAAHSPLTLGELKEYCGAMFSHQRLESLIHIGDIKSIPGHPDIYWSVPPAMKKRNTMRRIQPGMKPSDREKYLSDIVALREKLSTLSRDLDALLLRKDQFPTQEQIQAHVQRLHRYNEQKDIGQALLGHLAELRKCKVQAMYDDYNINEDD